MSWEVTIKSDFCPHRRMGADSVDNCEHEENETKLCRVIYCPIVVEEEE